MAVCLGSMAGTLGSIGHSMLQLSKPGMRALWVVDELCHSFMGLPSSVVERWQR